MASLDGVGAREVQEPADAYAALKRALAAAHAAWYDPQANVFDYRAFQGSAERRVLAEASGALGEFPCGQLAVGKRLPFWLNVYNALALEAVAALGAALAARLGKDFFAQSRLVVGGHAFSLDDIEHGLIRGNAPRFLGMRRQMPAGDPRLAFAPYVFDERAHFALHSACRSSPPLRIYGRESLGAVLEEAACDYVRRHARLEEDGAVLRVPKLFQWYAPDFGGEEGVRAFVANRLEREEDIEALDRRGGDCALRYAEFDWSLNQR